MNRGPDTEQHWLHVAVGQQRLYCMHGQQIRCQYPVSTASKGVGCRMGSEQTPLGWHLIRAKIGAGLPVGSVFVGRRPTGEIYTKTLGQRYPKRDWILTRILWLSGLERGKNRLGQVDSMRRYIYIHGCPDSDPMGQPGSHGCIRMRHTDLLALFETISCGIKLNITR